MREARTTILLFVLFLFVPVANAQMDEDDIFNIVLQNTYRADTRPPEEVFNTGFQNLGDNDRIIEHVEGESCFSGTQNSAFISTTLHSDFAVNWLSEGRNSGNTYYVYEIRPTNNFYDVTSTLLRGYQITQRQRFWDVAYYFQGQAEVVAFGGISAEQIVSAREYITTGVNTPPTLVRVINNANYVNDAISDSYGSAYPYVYADDAADDSSSCSSYCSVESSSRASSSSEEQCTVVDVISPSNKVFKTSAHFWEYIYYYGNPIQATSKYPKQCRVIIENATSFTVNCEGYRDWVGLKKNTVFNRFVVRFSGGQKGGVRFDKTFRSGSLSLTISKRDIPTSDGYKLSHLNYDIEELLRGQTPYKVDLKIYPVLPKVKAYSYGR